MISIEATFNRLRAQGRAALMPFITMGFPRRESAFELVPALVEGGADLIELGVPFSDPVADGATIQAASQRALQNGMSLALCLQQAAELRSRGVQVPFVLMGYYNPIFQMGESTFARCAAEAGIQGVIVPDLPPEEADSLQAALRAHGLHLIFLLAPTSDGTRVKLVTHRASGFIYLVSLTGVTGPRDRLPPDLEQFVARVRRATSLPLAVGFGIARPEHAAHVARIADGVIVGSALLKAIDRGDDPVAAARQFVADLRAGIEAARAARPGEAPQGVDNL
ncbi:MAG: tryptophan synthase subunit alpha [Ardenticatenia bacterium]|nr:tryptophan synthase subunit alpha [Ardenticatenia bacterium]